MHSREHSMLFIISCPLTCNTLAADRLSLDSKSTAHSSLTSLGQSLAKYLNLDPSELSKWGISSSADLVDFLSKVQHLSCVLSIL